MRRTCLKATLVVLAAFAAIPATASAGAAAQAYGTWSPGRFDTCPAQLHDR